MRVGILGSGSVAQALGAGFLQHGHEVMLGTRDPGKLRQWVDAHPGAQVGEFPDAAGYGELLVLSVKGAAAEQALRQAGEAQLAGKVVIDTTNPIADEPPDNAVIRYFTGPNESLMERLQAAFPQVRFVKAFNSVGNAHMVDPQFPAGPPTMFICGDDPDAKQQVGGLLSDFGWEVADLGNVEAARAIEPLCVLWCVPGLRNGDWNHAFRLLRG